MSTQHTPGPWQHNHLDFLQICDADGEARGCAPIARVSGGKNAETRAEARANARLICAAPDLLKALQELIRHRDELGMNDYPAVTRARAAIQRASDAQE